MLDSRLRRVRRRARRWLPDTATSADVTVAVSGVSATAAIGSVGVALSVALSGLSATASPGTITPSTDVALTGAATTSSVGTVLPSTSVSLSGLAVDGSAGTVTPSGGDAGVTQPGGGLRAPRWLPRDLLIVGADVTVTLTGVTARASIGTMQASHVVTLSGAQSRAAAGSLRAMHIVSLHGTQATSAAGFLMVISDLARAEDAALMGRWLGSDTTLDVYE